MKIIPVPHQTLRAVAKPVDSVNEELISFIEQLEHTLAQKENPRGVGLSAPQVDRSLRVFTTLLDDESADEETLLARTFINPQVVSTSKNKTFGDNPKSPLLEGCLSIPLLYGPVPRFEWVEYSFQIIENGELKTRYETFYDFAARVMQHEYDHLEGVLFTDYSLEFGLPLYQEEHGKMKLIDTKVAKKF